MFPDVPYRAPQQQVQQPAPKSVDEYLYVWKKSEQDFARQQQQDAQLKQILNNQQQQQQALDAKPRNGMVSATPQEVMMPPEVLGGTTDGRPVMEYDVVNPIEYDDEFDAQEAELQEHFDGLEQEQPEPQQTESPLFKIMQGKESNSNVDLYGENADLWSDERKNLTDMTVQQVIDEGRSTLRKVHSHNRSALDTLKENNLVTEAEYEKYKAKPWLINRKFWTDKNKSASDAGVDVKLRIPSAASGTYQFTTTTLMDMMKGDIEGIDANSKFDDATQAKLAEARLRKDSFLKDYLDGNIEDTEENSKEAVKRFGNIWEAFTKEGNKAEAAETLRAIRQGGNSEVEPALQTTEEQPEETVSESQTTSSPNVVKVKSGDTLGKLAKAYKLTVPQLMALNPSIKDANKISVGQEIKLS